MNKSETITNLAKALCQVQKKLSSVPRDADNPFFKSRFSSLEAVIESSKDLLFDAGLAITQLPVETEHGTVIETVLMHNSGEWISGTLGVRTKDTSAQALGSGISYARRYALMSVLRLASEDDDGNNATHTTATTSKTVTSSSNGSTFQYGNAAPDPTQGTHNNVPLEKWTFNFGKFKGLSLSQIPEKELESYKTYLCESSAKEGKPLSQGSSVAVDMIQKYLNKSKESFNQEDIAF